MAPERHRALGSHWKWNLERGKWTVLEVKCRVLEEGRTPDRVWDKEGPEQGAEKTSSRAEETRNKRKASQGIPPNIMERSRSDEPETAH